MPDHLRRPFTLSATLVMGGVVLSGPIGTVLASQVAPQPEWSDVATFAAYYHPIQALPFWFGFLMVSGLVLFVAAGRFLLHRSQAVRGQVAMIATAAFAAMVSGNYVVQVAWVPAAVERPDRVLAALTMNNPSSLCWAFEMFGYGFLGAATWLISPGFRDGRYGRLIARLLVLNGILSVAGAAFTGVDLTWVLTAPGLVSYGLWNALIVTTMVLVLIRCHSE